MLKNLTNAEIEKEIIDLATKANTNKLAIERFIREALFLLLMEESMDQ